jgi:hypothetical protein
MNVSDRRREAEAVGDCLALLMNPAHPRPPPQLAAIWRSDVPTPFRTASRGAVDGVDRHAVSRREYQRIAGGIISPDGMAADRALQPVADDAAYGRRCPNADFRRSDARANRFGGNRAWGMFGSVRR